MNTTKFQLLNAFANRSPLTVIHGAMQTKFAVINAIEHEDGSARSFNVTGLSHIAGYREPQKTTIYLKTAD